MRNKLGIFVVLVFFGLVYGIYSTVFADSITTSVTVGNTAPSFTTDATCTSSYPCESPARSLTSPVDVGTSTTFRATANEPNNENYYLIVCKTDVFNTNGGAAPTCDTSQTICVSTATASDAAATCNYTALAGDAEETAWYAEVCDNNSSSQACSSSTQGNTGGAADEASPLVVNHAPTVTSVSNDSESGSANDPGQNVVWSSVASDPDTTMGDTISLYVCSTNSFNGSACGATEYCNQTGQASNPTCSYAIPAGTSDDASPYSAYAFIVDDHQFDSSVSTQDDFYVANVAPSILSISLNSGSAITLTGGEYPATTSASFAVNVQDNNGCSDLNTPTSYVIYRSGVTNAETCTGNTNDCYTGDTGAYAVTCTSGSTCTGGTDVDATYTCSADLQYHTDPTVANTPWDTDTWLSYFDIDDNNSSATNSASTGVELNMLQALNAGNLSYGSMNEGTNSATLTDSNTITNTGNTAIDAQVSSAAAMDDGQGHTIAVNNQRADPTSGTAWASAAVTLSGTGQTVQTDTTKTTVDTSPVTDYVYWGINIPSGQTPGDYTGSTTVSAIYSAVGQGW